MNSFYISTNIDSSKVIDVGTIDLCIHVQFYNKLSNISLTEFHTVVVLNLSDC